MSLFIWMLISVFAWVASALFYFWGIGEAVHEAYLVSGIFMIGWLSGVAACLSQSIRN